RYVFDDAYDFQPRPWRITSRPAHKLAQSALATEHEPNESLIDNHDIATLFDFARGEQPSGDEPLLEGFEIVRADGHTLHSQRPAASFTRRQLEPDFIPFARHISR